MLLHDCSCNFFTVLTCALVSQSRLNQFRETKVENLCMRRLANTSLAVIGAVSLMLLTSTISSAQKLPKRIHIQATAMGTMTQMGRLFSVNLIIEEVSSDQERAGLLEAFQAKGNEGLQNALEKMHAKGRMAITDRKSVV